MLVFYPKTEADFNITDVMVHPAR
jgi:hypothetical protein